MKQSPHSEIPTARRPAPGRIAICATLAFAFAAAAGQAQEPAAAPVEPGKDAPKVESIPVEEIGVASQRAQSVFKEMAESLTTTEPIAEVVHQLPGLRKNTQEVLQSSKATRLENPTVLALGKSSTQLKSGIANLDNAQRILGERASAVADQIKTARKRRDVWNATREAAVEREVEPAVVAPIDDAERTINDALKRATERQAAIVELQSEVAGLSESLSAELKAVEALQLIVVGEVLRRDQAPIWSREFWTFLNTDEIGEQFIDEQESQTNSIAAFLQEERDPLARHLLLTVLFAGLAFYLRPIARSIFAGENEVASVRAIFEGPLILTALVSFLVALIWIPPKIAALQPLLLAATLFPAVVLTRRIVGPTLHPMLNALVLFFIVGQIRTMLAPVAVVERMIFVAEISAAILVLAYFLRPARLAEIPEAAANGLVLRVVGASLRFALFAAIVALLADITGYGGLAHLIGEAVALSAYASAIFYGAVRVADGLVIFALRVRPLNQLAMVRRYRVLIQRRAERLLNWIGGLCWAAVTLNAAQLLDTLESTVITILTTPLPLPEVELTPGDLLASALTFWAALLISRFLRFVLNEDIFPRTQLPKGRPYAISTLLHYIILVVGFLLAGLSLGFDLNRFTLLAGAFGVGIGFGLQTIVNNFVSGIILLTERPVEIGDTISLGEVFGNVERIGIRSSTVRTWQGAEIIVPNADLIALQVTNWTLSDRKRRMEIPVGVAYGSDPRQVIEILVQAASASPLVLHTPEPYALFNGFGDSSLDFEVRAWTDDFDSYLQIRSDICTRIVDALAEADIVIPFPQRDLHLKEAPQVPSGAPKTLLTPNSETTGVKLKSSQTPAGSRPPSGDGS